GDELIDDHLRGVAKVAELRFPKDQALGAIETVAILETEYGGFGQRAVENLHRRLLRREILQRAIAAATRIIVQDRMPLAERAAGGVLAAQSNAMSFERERGKRERFGRGPIERLRPRSHLPARFEE